jgi:ADP-ribose pyrophosphatase YjhB (NUDIX family)
MSAKLFEEVNYCLRCGHPVELEEHFGKLRPSCPNCGWIYFADPKVAVAALIEQGDQILLVRRVNDPQRGLWTLPAGFVDAGEDPAQAIVRECLEETGLHVQVMGLLDVLAGQEHSRGAHILIVYRASVLSGTAHPGDDADALAYFSRSQLPELAFSTTRQILEKSIRDS